MDDQNPQNQSNSDLKPKMSSESQNSAKNGSSSTAGQSSTPKKPKSEKQKLRERERRRRRRRKKNNAGKDVPLVLTEKKADNKGLGENIAPQSQQPADDIRKFEESSEAKVLENETADAHLLPTEGEHAPEVLAESEAESDQELGVVPESEFESVSEADSAHAKPSITQEPNLTINSESPTNEDHFPAVESAATSVNNELIEPEEGQPEIVSPPTPEILNLDEVVPEADSAISAKPKLEIMSEPESANEAEPEEQSQQPIIVSPAIDEKSSNNVFEEEFHSSDEHSNDVPSNNEHSNGDDSDDEHHKEKSNLEQAKKISEDLISDPEPYLEELPVKQGVLGKMFDWFANKVESRRKGKIEKPPSSSANAPTNPSNEPTKITEINLGGYDASTAEEVLPEAENKTSSFGLIEILKRGLSVIVLIALIIGAFWLGSSLHLVERITDMFKTKPGLELAQGENVAVHFDAELLRKWGFYAAQQFGRNLGDSRNTAYAIFTNAYYFGKLRDPIFVGETGISAALYYGFGRDDDYLRDKFIFYVRYLAQIHNANQTDVLSSLSDKVRRDVALDNLLEDLNNTFNKGNDLRKEINVQVDDFKVSFNSLNPDKDRFEADFFTSLDQLEAEKADLLINKFIEISQKQIELKAKLAAMERLAADYESELIKLKLKIEGAQKNRAALIQGVTVTEVPGSGVDLVNN